MNTIFWYSPNIRWLLRKKRRMFEKVVKSLQTVQQWISTKVWEFLNGYISNGACKYPILKRFKKFLELYKSKNSLNIRIHTLSIKAFISFLCFAQDFCVFQTWDQLKTIKWSPAWFRDLFKPFLRRYSTPINALEDNRNF